MKIIHVATLVTPDGAYGGPVRVALNQLRELASRGHEVELVAGTRGFGREVPAIIDGVPVRLFPARQLIPRTGYAGMIAPGLNRYLTRRLKEVDIVQVHLARDLISMPAATAVVRSSTPLVCQPHGMIIEPRNAKSLVFDLLSTRRVLKSSTSVLALTSSEASSLQNVARNKIHLKRIINGVPVQPLVPASSEKLEVLFLARLHERKRPAAFVEMATQLLADGLNARFTLIGPDEGEGPAVKAKIAASGMGDLISWEGALAPERTLDRIISSDIYVLPSIGEVFPMSVLEAMSVGRPIVMTSSNGLAAPLKEADAALIVDETLGALVEGVRTLLSDQQARLRLGRNAHALAGRAYSMQSVARQLESLYRPLDAQPGGNI